MTNTVNETDLNATDLNAKNEIDLNETDLNDNIKKYKPTLRNRFNPYKKKITEEDKENYNKVLKSIPMLLLIKNASPDLNDIQLYKTNNFLSKILNKEQVNLDDLKDYLSRDYIYKSTDNYLIEDISKIFTYEVKNFTKMIMAHNCKQSEQFEQRIDCISKLLQIEQNTHFMEEDVLTLSNYKKINNKTIELLNKIVSNKNKIIKGFSEIYKNVKNGFNEIYKKVKNNRKSIRNGSTKKDIGSQFGGIKRKNTQRKKIQCKNK
jgi:hypothetical protein